MTGSRTRVFGETDSRLSSGASQLHRDDGGSESKVAESGHSDCSEEDDGGGWKERNVQPAAEREAL